MVWRIVTAAAAALIATGMGITAASAATSTGVCGSDVTVTSNGLQGVFDPFSPTTQQFANVSLTFSRQVGAGSNANDKTNDMAFYFLQPAGSPSGNQVIWLDSGQNILFTSGGTVPVLNYPPSAVQPSGVAYVSWGGAAQPNVIQKSVNVAIDPAFNPAASQYIYFDLVYVCKGTGGFSDQKTPQTKTGVIQIHIQVLSGLQASYAGPALDFGEIGQVSNAQASGHSLNGQFQVKSSGAFTVAMTSGNHFLMTYSGGPSTTPNVGTVGYELGFGGQTTSFANQSFTTLSCHRVGVSSWVYLPIAAKLLEGGQGKTPSPNYQDLLSVTFTPLVDTDTGTADCQTLTAPIP